MVMSQLPTKNTNVQLSQMMMTIDQPQGFRTQFIPKKVSAPCPHRSHRVFHGAKHPQSSCSGVRSATTPSSTILSEWLSIGNQLKRGWQWTTFNVKFVFEKPLGRFKKPPGFKENILNLASVCFVVGGPYIMMKVMASGAQQQTCSLCCFLRRFLVVSFGVVLNGTMSGCC